MSNLESSYSEQDIKSVQLLLSHSELSSVSGRICMSETTTGPLLSVVAAVCFYRRLQKLHLWACVIPAQKSPPPPVTAVVDEATVPQNQTTHTEFCFLQLGLHQRLGASSFKVFSAVCLCTALLPLDSTRCCYRAVVDQLVPSVGIFPAEISAFLMRRPEM